MQGAGVTRWYDYGLQDPVLTPDPPPPRIAAYAGRMACVLPATTNAAIVAAASPGEGTYWLVGNEPNNPGVGGHLQTPEQYATRLYNVVNLVRSVESYPIFIGPQVWNWDDRLGGEPTGREFTMQAMAAYESAYGGWPCSALSLHTYLLNNPG